MKKKRSHLQSVFFSGLSVVTLHNLAVYAETEHVIADLVVVRNRRFLRKPFVRVARHRIFHRHFDRQGSRRRWPLYGFARRNGGALFARRKFAASLPFARFRLFLLLLLLRLSILRCVHLRFFNRRPPRFPVNEKS